MKKALVIFLVVVFVLAIATPAFAAKPDKDDKVTGQDKESSTVSTNQSKADDKVLPKSEAPGQDKKVEVGGGNPPAEPLGQEKKQESDGGNDSSASLGQDKKKESVGIKPSAEPSGQQKKLEVDDGNISAELTGQVDKEHPKGAPPGQVKKEETEKDPKKTPPGQAKKNTIYTYSGTFVLVKDREGDGFSGELRDYNSSTGEYEHYSYWVGTRDTQTTDLNGTTFWIGDWTVHEYYGAPSENDSFIYLTIADFDDNLTGIFYYDNDALTYQDSTFTVTEILYDGIRLEGDWVINFSLSTKSRRKAK